MTTGRYVLLPAPVVGSNVRRPMREQPMPVHIGKAGQGYLVHQNKTRKRDHSFIAGRLFMKRLANILVGGLLLASTLASADPITINNAFYFRENRGVNDIGVTAGDRLVYGVNAVTPNGNDGTTATREFVALPPAANNPAVLPFNPSTDRPNQFSGSIAYTAARAASHPATLPGGTR